DHDVGADLAPRQRSGVALGKGLDRVRTDDELVSTDLDLVVEPPEHGVVLEQLAERVHVTEIVEADQLNVGAGGEQRSEEVTADPTEAVDTNPGGHRFPLLATRGPARRPPTIGHVAPPRAGLPPDHRWLGPLKRARDGWRRPRRRTRRPYRFRVTIGHPP